MLQKVIVIIDQKKIITRSVIIVLATLFLFANKVSADFTMPPVAPGGVITDLEAAILNLTNWILGFVAIIAVLAIVWGGVTYIGSAGDENKTTNGKNIVTYALIGLVVAGIAYALVNVVVTVIL